MANKNLLEDLIKLKQQQKQQEQQNQIIRQNKINNIQHTDNSATQSTNIVNKNLSNTNKSTTLGSLEQEKEKIKNAHLSAKNGTNENKIAFANMIQEINNNGTDLQKKALKEYSDSIKYHATSYIDNGTKLTPIDYAKQNLANSSLGQQFGNLKNNIVDTAKQIDDDINISGIAENLGLSLQDAGANVINYLDKAKRYISKENIASILANSIATQFAKNDNEIKTGIFFDGEELNVRELKAIAEQFKNSDPEKYNKIINYADEIYKENRDTPISSVIRDYAKNERAKVFEKDKEYNSGIIDYISDNWAENDEINNERHQKIQENIDKSNNVVSRKIAELSGGAGNTALGAIGSAINPALGAALFMTSAGGSYYNDAKQRGMNDDEAFGYATIMGGVEGATEKFITGDMVSKAKKLATGTGLSQKLLQSYGINIAENFLQEALTEPISESVAYVIGGEDTANFENMKERMIESGIDGLLSATLFAGASAGIGSAVSVIDKSAKATIQEKVKAINDTINSKKVNMSELANGVVNGIKTNIKDLQDKSTNNQINNYRQQFTQQNNKMSKDGLSEEINNKNVENNIQSVYNNTERESGINGQTNQQNDRRRIQKLFELYEKGKRIEENSSTNFGKTISEEEIKTELINYANKNKKTNLTKLEKKLSNIAQNLGGNVIFYDFGKDNIFYGLSNAKNNTFYIDTSTNASINNVFYHELTHYLRQSNNDIYQKEIQPIVNELANNYDYQEVLYNYAKSVSEEIPIEYLYGSKQQILAEEVIADYVASLYGNLPVNYGLSKKMINQIRSGMNKILRNNKLNITTENTSIEAKLPTKEYIENKQKREYLTDKDYEVLNKIYEKEGRTEILTKKKKANILDKYANDKFAIKDSIDILVQKIVNKGHYIDKLSKEAKNPELKFLYDRNLNSFAEGQYVIGVAQTDNNGKTIGKSLNDIWKPIEDNNLTKDFSEYLLHKHNIARSGKGKYIFGEEIGPTESTSIAMKLEQEHPEFKEYAKDIKEFNHNNLVNLKESGLVSQDIIDYLETTYPDYIVVSRTVEDKLYTGSNDKTGTNAPIKKATGGNADIQPLKDAMAEQVIRIKRLVNQNELGKELSKTLKNAKVEDNNVDIEVSPAILLDMDAMVDTDINGDKFYIYFENGKQKKLKINDNLYESLKPTQISKIEKTLPLKALQKVTNIHRSLLTTNNPLFIATNFFKDFQDGMFNSKYSRKFFKNYGKAINEFYTKGKYYQSYMANGGMNNSYFDYNEGVKKKSNKFVENIRGANEIVEQLPRLAEFISTLEDGKSLNEALYNAAEITTNFKRGGDITKAINRNGVNFLNASIQGLDKFYRNISGQNGIKGYVNLLAKATIMSIAPSILNHILLDDDEDYKDLPQSTKDLYYLFKTGDGKFIRIPKGRVLSIFGAAARRTIETVQGQDDSWDKFGDTIINQVAPNNPLEDNILAPVIQVNSNKTWYGGDLVSSRLQDELPKNQYDETTDEFSKWLGNKLNISPKKINYLIDQYSGGIGDMILPVITPQAKQNALADKFTTDSVLKNKNVSKFYDTLEKQTQISNDSFATDEDRLKLKYLTSISKEMSELYKEKREVQMSKISNKEKTEKVREIQSQINNLAEEGLSNYNSISKNNSYSKIGNQNYYKNQKGEWSTLSDEEEEKLGELSYNTYFDYKQKFIAEKNKQLEAGKIEKGQDLKNKDKIQILLNSNYSKDDIAEVYENFICNNKDNTYNIMKKSNIDIKEYLKYKQQDFESDKTDDGTVNGKSISGSKKKKVYDYVNSMNIDYNQKLLLLGQQYKLTNDERTKLAKYVNSLNLNKQDKLDIYSKLQGFTVYKDGTVKW